jgi:hypothetical protein
MLLKIGLGTNVTTFQNNNFFHRKESQLILCSVLNSFVLPIAQSGH